MQEQWLGVQAVEGFDAFAVVNDSSEGDAFVNHLASEDRTAATPTITATPMSGAAAGTSKSSAARCSFYEDAAHDPTWSAEKQSQVRERIRLRLGLPSSPAIMGQNKRRCL